MSFLIQVLIFIYFFSIVSINAFASECKPIRLDAPGKSMSKIPVMDQDSKWICYAYTASQMVDAWRFSHGDTDYDHLTSPIAAAVFYASQRRDYPAEDIDYGWQADAVSSIAKNGSCGYKSIYSKFGQNGLREYFGELKNHFNEFAILAYQKSVPASVKTKFAQQVQCSIQKAGTGVPVPTIIEITNALSQPSYLKYLEKLFKPVCDNNSKQVKDIPAAKKLWMQDIPERERFTKIQGQMNDQFNNPNPQPMSINYCENVLWDKKTVGIDSSGQFNWSACKSHHISVVVGQRPTNDGRCEFLVRNSYGQSCYAYPDWKCENGQVWVDSKTLINNMHGLSWLEDK